jgi:hypothetical protein
VALLLRRVLAWLVWNNKHAKDLEIVVLRHQLQVLRRQVGRPRFRWSDRLFLAAASRRLARETWRAFLVTPQTVLRWHTVVERWKGRVSGQASETGPRIACSSSWGPLRTKDSSCCRPRADTRSSDLLVGLRRLLGGGAPVIPGRRSVQIPALREFRIPHIREFGNMVEVCAASAGSAGCFCQGPPCERLASPPSVRPHLPRAAGHADESRPSAQAGGPGPAASAGRTRGSADGRDRVFGGPRRRRRTQ